MIKRFFPNYEAQLIEFLFTNDLLSQPKELGSIRNIIGSVTSFNAF